MLITKREEVTKQGFCKILWKKISPRGSLLLELIHLSGWGGGERLLTFSAFRMGAYSRWALIRGWALSNKYGKLSKGVGKGHHNSWGQLQRALVE